MFGPALCSLGRQQVVALASSESMHHTDRTCSGTCMNRRGLYLLCVDSCRCVLVQPSKEWVYRLFRSSYNNLALTIYRKAQPNSWRCLRTFIRFKKHRDSLTHELMLYITFLSTGTSGLIYGCSCSTRRALEPHRLRAFLFLSLAWVVWVLLSTHCT